MTMYLDDSLTPDELSEATREQQLGALRDRAVRRVHQSFANPHGIPCKGKAPADFLVPGDMIAMYAGNPWPSHVTTVTVAPKRGKLHTDVETTDGNYSVPNDSLLWVAAWAPVLTS